MIHPDAASLIGGTPIVELKRLTRGLRGALSAKVEFLNPGLSKKDRIARQIIDDAIAAGQLRPGDTVVELTSGNTGTGLAIVCAVRGLRFVAVMSAGSSAERRRMMEALGARVEIVPQAPGSPPGHTSGEDLALVERRAQEITAELKAFRADQFRNASNERAHEEGTAQEIWADLGERVTAFCDFVGTGGTLLGISRALKRRNPRIRCYAVEPASAAVLAGHRVTNQNHRIQGGGYSMTVPRWDPTLVDGYLAVTDEEAIHWARELASREGLFAGFSSGANVAGAMKLLEASQKESAAAHVVLTINDSGLKYLSTDLWA
jgi:cysteine synthase